MCIYIYIHLRAYATYIQIYTLYACSIHIYIHIHTPTAAGIAIATAIAVAIAKRHGNNFRTSAKLTRILPQRSPGDPPPTKSCPETKPQTLPIGDNSRK